MTMNIEAAVGSQVKLYFAAPASTSSFPDTLVMIGSALVGSPALAITPIGNGLFTADYTPTVTGVHCVFLGEDRVFRIEVVQKTAQTILKNLEDEALGSWSWDKQAGTLTMLRQDGTDLASFDVTETLELASRERTN